MPAHIVPLSESLPRSHYFLTLSRGSGMRTVAVRALVVHVAALLLPMVVLTGLCSTLYIVFHDDLMAGMMRRESAMQYAYEDRIEGLRQDLERQTAAAREDRTKLDSRMHDLFARQAKLETRAATVASLGADAGAPARPALPPEITIAIDGPGDRP